MAAVGSDVVKGCLEKCDGSQCSSTTVHSTEHTFTNDKDDTGVTGVSHSVPASKSETKPGVYVGHL